VVCPPLFATVAGENRRGFVDEMRFLMSTVECAS
jgi:hypothetical protein